MKKFIYLLAIAALGLASCTTKGYKITGTMEGSADGDTVYIMERTNREFVRVDSTVIANGKFTFAGVQDSAVYRYISYKGADDQQPLYLDFFLENGNLQIEMVRTEGGDVVSGTPTNDAYQIFKNDLQAAFKNQGSSENELPSVIKKGIHANISTPLGLFLLNNYNYYMDFNDLDEILSTLPANYSGDERVIHLKGLVEVAKKTAVGQKFVDFEMNDPKGNPVKLSDYAGKGKLVLVDFWASWCGPCRREMPKLVEAYAKYKNKGFEIVGVSLDRSAEPWVKGLEQMNMTWPQMSDLKFWDSEGAKLYAIRSIPHVILIDGEGTIIARGLHGEELHAKLAELLP